MVARSAPRPGLREPGRNRGSTGARSTSRSTGKHWQSGLLKSPAAMSAMPRCHCRPWCCRDHPAAQERQTLEGRHHGGNRAQRSLARIETVGPRAPATLERLSPPEPRRDMSRAGKPSGGSFSRRMDALREPVGSAPHGAGLRPPGRRVPGWCCRAERLHRARHPRHEGRGISLSGRRGSPAVSRFVQQSLSGLPWRPSLIGCLRPEIF